MLDDDHRRKEDRHATDFERIRAQRNDPQAIHLRGRQRLAAAGVERRAGRRRQPRPDRR